MIPVTTLAGCPVAVVGLGGSGLPTARALMASGARVVAWDDGEAARDKALAAGVKLVPVDAMDWAALDALILSPGIPLTHPRPHAAVVAAHGAGVPVVGDVDLFFAERAARRADAPVLAITGTNGKSTTTALADHALRAMGVETAMGGNIGVPVLDLPGFEDPRTYVLECSSYQIDLAPHLAPTVGVHLNLSEDHLARHGTMENYAAIKERLVDRAHHAVIGVDDPWSRAMAERRAATGRPLTRISVTGVPDSGVFAEGSCIFSARDGHRELVMDLAGVASLKGAHNAQNVCAVVGALTALGCDLRALGDAIRSFPGLAHRMEPVASLRNVAFVNDSKATNADAAARALGSFDPIYWIVGGQAKSDGIDPLNGFFPQIVKAYLVGEAQDRFAATLEGKLPHVRAETIERATRLATQDALADGRPGATVLLSPACASWDQFTSFEARGDAFKRVVADLIGEARAHE